jgi:hypothetical protein
MTKATKKDALDAAIGLLAQGMKDVTITDEQGGCSNFWLELLRAIGFSLGAGP